MLAAASCRHLRVVTENELPTAFVEARNLQYVADQVRAWIDLCLSNDDRSLPQLAASLGWTVPQLQTFFNRDPSDITLRQLVKVASIFAMTPDLAFFDEEEARP